MIWFVGAGPGDPELITVRGRRLLETADVVVYTGSLVPREMLSWASPHARLYDSSGMYLEQVVSVMTAAHREGQRVVRLHTGDPSLFSAVAEQMAALEAQQVPYEVVPGVSSFAAAAAVLGAELTLPGVSQTVIITRAPGRTPVPATESLADLARHRATMAIFLSAHRLPQVVPALLSSYPKDTPVAVVYKATQPEQKVVKGTLSDIVEKVADAGITRTAMILVGQALDRQGERSRLYHPGFDHGHRPAVDVGRETP